MLLDTFSGLKAPDALKAGASSCDRCAVRGKAICGSLSQEELADLNRLGRHIRLAKGQTLVWESDESLLVGNVLDGMLKLATMTGDGREQIVGIVFPSDFIGRPFGGNSGQTVTALTDARVCVFSRGAFDKFANCHREIEKALLRRTLDELDRARRWMLILGRLSATEKVASLLLEMTERLGGGDGREIMLPLSRQQMGDLLGLALETVSRVMSRFKDAGVIALPGGRRLIVTNLFALAQIAAR